MLYAFLQRAMGDRVSGVTRECHPPVTEAREKRKKCALLVLQVLGMRVVPLKLALLSLVPSITARRRLSMLLATVNKSRQLLVLSFIGEVRSEELAQRREEVVTLMAELAPGFRLLTDWTHLHSMPPESLPEIGKFMELCDQKGVGLVVRVIPDPSKDFGLNILSLFHYARRPRAVTCANMIEAAEVLSL